MAIIEGEDLDKVAALLEDFEEINIDDQDDDASLKAINVLNDKGLSIMVYPDSFATITDPENNSTRSVKFGDNTYEVLAQYIDYDIDDLDLGS